MTAPIPRTVLSLCAALLPSAAAWAGVLEVAPSGAPFTNVQAAVNAALDGDTVLVRPGTYEGFEIAAKSLSVVARPELGATITSQVRVRDLAAGLRALIAGFQVHVDVSGAVRCQSNAGSVRLEGLQTLHPLLPTTFSHGLDLEDCADVAVLRCELIGGPSFGSFPSNPGAGLEASSSNVAVYDCVLRGGQGSSGGFLAGPGSAFPPIAGGDGCRLDGNRTFYAASSTFTGGGGGQGRPATCFPGPIAGGAGAPGGAGLNNTGPGSAWSRGASFQGGPGGLGGSGAVSCSAPAGPDAPDGVPIQGAQTAFGGPQGVMTLAASARELEPVTLSIAGAAGDLVWIHTGLDPRWNFEPVFSGVRLVGTGLRRAFLGTLPGSGAISAQIAFGELGPGIFARTVHLQSFFRGPDGSARHGSAAAIAVLDASIPP